MTERQTNHTKAAEAHEAAAFAYSTGNENDIDAATEQTDAAAGRTRGQNEAADRATAAAQWIDAASYQANNEPDAAAAAAIVHWAAAAAHWAAEAAAEMA